MEILPFETQAREQGLDQGQLLERFLVEFLCLGLTFRIRGGLPVTIVDARKPSVSGNAEAGLDVEGWTSEGKKWLFQCKNKSKVDAKEVRDWMVEVRPRLEGGELEGAIFLTSSPLGRAITSVFENPSNSTVQWDWWDGRCLASHLLKHQHRLGCLDLVSRHFTLTIARQFFGEFEKLLISGKEYQAQPRGPGFNHDGEFIGESKAWPKLLDFARTEAPGQVLLLHASAGLGKTRVLIELSRRIESDHPGVCLRFLNPKSNLASVSTSLPDQPQRCCIVWDDAHQQPERMPLIAEWLQRGARVLIATRPAALPQVRAGLAKMGSAPLNEINLPELTHREITELVERALDPTTEDTSTLAIQFAQRFHPSPLMARMAVDYWSKHGNVPGAGGGTSDTETALFDHVVEESLQQLPAALRDTAKRLLRVHALIQPYGYDNELSVKVSGLLNCTRFDFDKIWQELRHCGLLGEFQGNRRLKIQPDALAEHLAFSTCQNEAYQSLVSTVVGLIRQENPDFLPSLLGNLAYVEWRSPNMNVPRQQLDTIWNFFDELYRNRDRYQRPWLLSAWQKFGFYVPMRAMAFAETVATTCIQDYDEKEDNDDWGERYGSPGEMLRGLPTWVSSLALGTRESRQQARRFLVWWIKQAGKVLKGNLAADAVLSLAPWLDAWKSTPEIARETWVWFAAEDQRQLRDPLLRGDIGFLEAFTKHLFQPQPRMDDELDHRLTYPSIKESLPGWHTLRMDVVAWLDRESRRDWRVARNASDALRLAINNFEPRCRDRDLAVARKHQDALHDRALAVLTGLPDELNHPAISAHVYGQLHQLSRFDAYPGYTKPLNALAERVDQDLMARGILLASQYGNLLQRLPDGSMDTNFDRSTEITEANEARRIWADSVLKQFPGHRATISWLGQLDTVCREAGMEPHWWGNCLHALCTASPALAQSLIETWTPDSPSYVRQHLGWLLRQVENEPTFIMAWADRALRSGDVASLQGLLASFASPECAALLPRDALRGAFSVVNHDNTWTWSLFIANLLTCDGDIRELFLQEFPWGALSRSGWNQLLQQMRLNRRLYDRLTWESLLSKAHLCTLDKQNLPECIESAWHLASTWNPSLIFRFLEDRVAWCIENRIYRATFPLDFTFAAEAPAEGMKDCARRLIERCLTCPENQVHRWRELFCVLEVEPRFLGELWKQALVDRKPANAERLVNAFNHDPHLTLLHDRELTKELLAMVERGLPSEASELRRRLIYGLLPSMWGGSRGAPPPKFIQIQDQALLAAQQEPAESILKDFYGEAARMAARQIEAWQHRFSS